MFKRYSAILALALLAGCYNNARLTNFGGSPGAEKTVWVHTLIGGIISLNDVNVGNICGDKGVYAVRTNGNLWTLLLTGVTFSIYAPLMVHVTCKE